MSESSSVTETSDSSSEVLYTDTSTNSNEVIPEIEQPIQDEVKKTPSKKPYNRNLIILIIFIISGVFFFIFGIISSTAFYEIYNSSTPVVKTELNETLIAFSQTSDNFEKINFFLLNENNPNQFYCSCECLNCPSEKISSFCYVSTQNVKFAEELCHQPLIRVCVNNHCENDIPQKTCNSIENVIY